MEKIKKVKDHKLPNFKTWLDTGNEILTYNNETKLFETSDLPPEGINSFYLPKSYQLKLKERAFSNIHTQEQYDEYLKLNLERYSKNLIPEREEVLNYPKLDITFDYFDNDYKCKGKTFYRSHKNNTITFLKRLLKTKKESGKKSEYKFSHYDPVHWCEYKWYKLCANGGLTYLRAVGKYYNCYGQDFSMSYPTDMSEISFMIPSKEGQEKTLSKLPDQSRYISYGIYRVRIESDDENFKQVFKFSKYHGYTHFSLRFAFEMAKTMKIKIELIQDGEPNAYIYDKSCLIHGNELFGNWYHRILDMKTDLPANGIVKLLSSSAWGHINELSVIHKTGEQLLAMTAEGIKIGNIDNYEDCQYVIVHEKFCRDTILFQLVDLNKPVYKIPIRLLPFITSFSRAKMGNLIKKYNLFDKVIRIQTDSITFSENPNLSVKGFEFDKKISGDLEFKSLNTYTHFEI